MDCLDDELLAELETGTLEERVDTAARAHLGACASCRELQRELAASVRAFAAMREDLLEKKPGARVWEAVATRLAADSLPATTILIACVYCKGRLDRAVYCASCLAPHHSDCWEEHGRCATCSATSFVQAQRHLTPKPRRRALVSAAVVLLLGGGVAALSLLGPPAGRPKAVAPLPGASSPPQPAPPVSIALRGRELRRFNVGERSTVARVDAVIGVDPGSDTLDFVSRDGTLRSIDRRQGRPVWRAPVRIGQFGDTSNGAAVLPGRAIFTASCDGTVRAHDTASGGLVWSTDVGSPIVVAPRVSPSGKAVVAATADGEVVVLDGTDGRVRSRLDVGRVSTAPALSEKLAYVAAIDELLAIDLATGRVVARFEAGAEITAGPILVEDQIWIGTCFGAVRSVAVANLARVETREDGAGPITSIFPIGRGVAWTAGDEVRGVFRRGSGSFQIKCAGAIAGVVSVSEDRLAVALEEGIVSVFDLTPRGDWVRVWSHSVAQPLAESSRVAVPPVFFGDELYICTREGEVVVLDPRK